MIPSALSMTGSTSSVNVGSGSSLDNVQTGSVMAWVKVTSVTSPKHNVFQKAIAALDSSYQFFGIGDGTNGNLSFYMNRASADLAITSPSGTAVTNRWQFVAASWNGSGAKADQHLYIGDLLTPAAETTYTTQEVGSGAFNSNAAASLYLGNKSNNSAQLTGVMALCVLSNVQLSLDEIRAVQYRATIPRGCIGFWRPGMYGRGVVIDESGSGNHGTQTACVPVSDVLPRVG